MLKKLRLRIKRTDKKHPDKKQLKGGNYTKKEKSKEEKYWLKSLYLYIPIYRKQLKDVKYIKVCV